MIKVQEWPFSLNGTLKYVKTEFQSYKLEKCPIPLFLDIEMEDLVERAMIDLEKRGMYKFLALTY